MSPDVVELSQPGSRAGTWAHPLALGGGNELRPFDPGDGLELFALIERNQSELARWLAWAQQPTEQATLAHIARARAGEAEQRCVFRAIVVQGKIVGDVGLASIDWPSGCAAIGYWLDHEHQGRGLVTAAVGGLVCSTRVSAR